MNCSRDTVRQKVALKYYMYNNIRSLLPNELQEDTKISNTV